MKASTFEEFLKLKPSYGEANIILKTSGKFGEATFWGIRETKAVFSMDSYNLSDWSCPNLSTYGKTWTVYPLKSKPYEPLTITANQLAELYELEDRDNLGAYHRKLKKLFGIKAVPFIAYEYYYLDNIYLGNSCEDEPVDLINGMGVKIEK